MTNNENQINQDAEQKTNLDDKKEQQNNQKAIQNNIQQEKKPKLSILEKASKKVDEQLGINKTFDAEKIKSPVVRKRLNKLRRTRKIMIWTRRLVIIILILSIIFIFWRFGTFTFDREIAGYHVGEKVLIDKLYSKFPWFIDNLKVKDEVIFFTRTDKSKISAGRIIARAGSKIELALDENNFLVFKIDGQIRKDIAEPKISSFLHFPAIVPEKSFFILEDKKVILIDAEIGFHFINESEAYIKINDEIRRDMLISQGAKILEVLGLKKDSTFLMRDFSVYGFDSRDFGFIPYENIYAKIVMQWSDAKSENTH